MAPLDHLDADARASRIAGLLDDLHLSAEDLTELAKQAVRRALQIVQQARAANSPKPGPTTHDTP